jgi:RNA polymerase sigma-70 factor (ECF subfamily)
VTTTATSTIAHHSDLIAAVAQHRDKAAFAELFQYFAPRVKAYLVRLGVPSGAADDLAQEVLLMLWRKAHLYDRSRAAPSTWVFTIARNLRIDAARRVRHTEALEDAVEHADDAPLSDAVVDAAQRDARVRSALKALPQDQLRVVELSFFEDKPHSDIARILNVPLGTVKSRLRLAMGRLRPLVGAL